MSTDILGGVQMGYRTVLVLSGGTGIEDVAKHAYTPDCIVNSVADLCSNGGITLSSLPAPNFDDDSVDLNQLASQMVPPQVRTLMKPSS